MLLSHGQVLHQIECVCVWPSRKVNSNDIKPKPMQEWLNNNNAAVLFVIKSEIFQSVQSDI